jgi:hypothetical protein
MAELKSGTKINSSLAIHQGNDANTINTEQGVNAATLDGAEATAFADASHSHADYARSSGHPDTPNAGDISVDSTTGVISIYSSGWKQVYPAVYS